jgi:hypothetical protein
MHTGVSLQKTIDAYETKMIAVVIFVKPMLALLSAAI